MKRIIILLVVFFLAGASHLRAQTNIQTTFFGVSNDTVQFNDVVTLSFAVQNTGNTTFSGLIDMYFTVNGIGYPYFLTQIDSTQTDTMQVGDSIFVYVPNLVIDPYRFFGGDNLVVIWPVAATGGPISVDSAAFNIYVDTTLGISTPENRNHVQLFYVSENQSVLISYLQNENEVQDVSLFNMEGQQLAIYKSAVRRMALRNFTDGLYFVRIRMRDGTSAIFKVMKHG